MENITIENLYDLTETIAAELFTEAEYPWEVLPGSTILFWNWARDCRRKSMKKEARISGWLKTQKLLLLPA